MKLDDIRGLKYPLEFGPDGKLLMSSGVQHLKESIAQVLMTAHGELPFWPTFGSELPKRAFTSVSRSAMLQADTADSIRVWCRNVELIAVRPINLERFAAGQMGYSVEFRHKDSSQGQTISIGLR